MNRTCELWSISLQSFLLEQEIHFSADLLTGFRQMAKMKSNRKFYSDMIHFPTAQL